MSTFGRWVVGVILAIIVVIAAVAWIERSASAPSSGTSTIATSTSPAQTYGMSEYIDPSYGFTFWYPSSLSVSVSKPNSTTNFPGGIDAERLDIGAQGGVYISVVQSASSTITDEPNGHASPIAQTKYSYDAPSGQWMIAYPEGTNTGMPGATTTADISKTTVAGLPMLPSGARFDTTIIPLSAAEAFANTTIAPPPMTEFLVIQDGGASSFTSALAATIAPIGASVDASLLSSALQAESAAYANQ